MARKIDPAVETILKSYGLKSAEVMWDCHGTWVMYHRALEKVAADQKITFDQPLILEANGATKSVAICVTGRFNDRAEWSIGEAAPGNNKNSYPYAMAEKRAKDRVILKLIGLHGLVYAEDEMPNTNGKPEQPETSPKQQYVGVCEGVIRNATNAKELLEWWNAPAQKDARRDFELTTDEVNALKNKVLDRKAQLEPHLRVAG